MIHLQLHNQVPTSTDSAERVCSRTVLQVLSSLICNLRKQVQSASTQYLVLAPGNSEGRGQNHGRGNWVTPGELDNAVLALAGPETVEHAPATRWEALAVALALLPEARGR